MALTLLDKLWQRHSIADLGEGFHLLFVDRHLLNDLAGRGFLTLNRRGLPLKHPELTFATADHTVATLWNADADPRGLHNDYVKNLRENCRDPRIPLCSTSTMLATASFTSSPPSRVWRCRA